MRLYRAAWAALAIPLLVVAFTVGQPRPLPAPRFEATFDQATALSLATELARDYPDRTPGTAGGVKATDWMQQRFSDVGLTAQRDTFTADLPALGETKLVNLMAVAPGASPGTIVVVAHRDNGGLSPGANDNGTGTAALLELARDLAVVDRKHTFLFLSTDAGAIDGAGAERFAKHPEILRRVVGGAASLIAVVNLDALAGGSKPQLLIGGDEPRSPAPSLVATAADAIEAETKQPPGHASAFAQLIDLAFPFTLHEQGPFVARATPSLTLRTGGERTARAESDTVDAIAPAQLGALGRSAQDLLLRLDDSAELARGTQSYVYVGDRIVRGWALQFLLVAALLPFLVATVDLFARCRRRRIVLGPAIRSLATRVCVWLWTGVLFALFAFAGLLGAGEARPPNPDIPDVGNWPATAIVVLCLLSAAGWLFVRPRLVPRAAVEREEELGGHLAALLALAVVGLLVAAANPYSLIFVLPSLHAWLWLPQVSRNQPLARIAIYAAGFIGPLILFGSFAIRLGLGFDAIWYVLSLVSVGYVAPVLVFSALVWAAAAGQLGAVAVGRYAPYPARGEIPKGGPLHDAVGYVVGHLRNRRAPADEPGEDDTPRLRSVD
jgi:hypothetical protein